MLTRKEKARELWRLATTGPAVRVCDGLSRDTQRYITEEAARLFTIWSEAHLQPLLRDLVPELREVGWFAIGVSMTVGVGGLSGAGAAQLLSALAQRLAARGEGHALVRPGPSPLAARKSTDRG